MNIIMQRCFILASLLLLAGCVEDRAYSGYYSSNDVNYHNSVTSGYNRDYHTAQNTDEERYTSQAVVNDGGYYSSHS